MLFLGEFGEKSGGDKGKAHKAAKNQDEWTYGSMMAMANVQMT